MIHFVKPDPNNFLGIGASVADTNAVDPNGIKTLSANFLSKCTLTDNPVFSNVLKIYLKILLIVLLCVIEVLIILC